MHSADVLGGCGLVIGGGVLFVVQSVVVQSVEVQAVVG